MQITGVRQFMYERALKQEVFHVKHFCSFLQATSFAFTALVSVCDKFPDPCDL